MIAGYTFASTANILEQSLASPGPALRTSINYST